MPINITERSLMSKHLVHRHGFNQKSKWLLNQNMIGELQSPHGMLSPLNQPTPPSLPKVLIMDFEKNYETCMNHTT